MTVSRWLRRVSRHTLFVLAFGVLAVGCFGGGDSGTPTPDAGALTDSGNTGVDAGAVDVPLADSGDGGGVDVPASDGCVGELCPSFGRARSALVGAGNRAQSEGFRMVSTLGQSSIHQSTHRSTGFVLRGGLVGAMPPGR